MMKAACHRLSTIIESFDYRKVKPAIFVSALTAGLL